MTCGQEMEQALFGQNQSPHGATENWFVWRMETAATFNRLWHQSTIKMWSSNPANVDYSNRW